MTNDDFIPGFSTFAVTLARRLAGEGASVLCTDMDLGRADAVATQITEAGGTASSLHADVGDPQHCEAQVDETAKRYGRIDILINNAGMLTNTSFSESDFALFEKIYKVNVFGLAELTRLLLPFIPSSGHVVNISSMGGIQGSAKFPGLSIYSSSKGAVITLTELWAEEFKETGPRFNALALGAVQTEMLAEAFPGFQAPVTADEFANYLLSFGLNGHQYYNGKVLQVSSSTP